ncbi:MAG: beta-glucosidase, partial [Microbacterium sp.]
VYAEDIFVGYRYFETFAPEKVQFPFGFGLGYTDFSLTVVDASSDDESVTVVVDVENTGGRDGRETVQLYVAAPGTRLAQPARSLVAFAKTALLASGESERVTLTVALDDLASFDDSGATGHRHAWVREEGEYRFFVGSDVRSAALAASVTLDEVHVVRRVTEVTAPVEPFDRMTVVRDADGTARVGWEPVPTATADRRARVLAALPPALAQTGDVGITLDAVAAGDATLDDFVAQLSDEELAVIARSDSDTPPSTPALPAAPSGIRLAAYASLLPSGTALAATWNPALVSELTALHGQEMIRKGSDVLLSPGMNIHRDPLCGRNFEYFSEDPLVTGRTAAAVVRGVQSQGVAACPKHFAANNQETNRTRNDSRLSERAFREIYLRGFELCVREARPLALARWLWAVAGLIVAMVVVGGITRLTESGLSIT